MKTRRAFSPELEAVYLIIDKSHTVSDVCGQFDLSEKFYGGGPASEF